MKPKSVITATNSLFSKSGIYALISIIKIYRIFISPLFPNTCKYYPSCSLYAMKSIKKHGLLKGGYYSTVRLFKCNPFSSGGIDFVKS